MQSVTLPSPPCACGRLRRASRALTQLYDDVMAPSGLRVTQFSLLRMLSHEKRMCISDLAQRLLLDRTALSRMLESLIERGLVSVAPGRDARRRELTLTQSGERAMHCAEAYWQRAQLQVAGLLGREKLEALVGVLGEVEALHPDPGGRAR